MKSDWEAAVAWQTEQNLKCPGCGQPKDEAWIFDPEKQNEREAWYKARTGPRLCVSCKVRKSDQQRFKEGGGDPHVHWWTLEESD